MGIDSHGFSFIRYSRKYRNFDRTVTIGRQELHVPESMVRDAVSAGADYKNDKYCEKLLVDYFGSSAVDSIDNSAYEDASMIHDMNQPLPPDVRARYDTVIDAGCLEHIYNIPQALKNCSQFCKPGGQILHISPANNFCGHGFWQLSPELFFSLYSEKNGYRNTEVFLADLSNTSEWFKVKCPQDGERVNINSANELYVLVRTVLRETDFSHANVHQSDYIFEWENGETGITRASAPAPSSRIKRLLKRSPRAYKLAASVYHLYRRTGSATKLKKWNPHLVEMNIVSLLESSVPAVQGNGPELRGQRRSV
jgi:SAM-dependent methyltransferase